jgi:hypothetical protein
MASKMMSHCRLPFVQERSGFPFLSKNIQMSWNGETPSVATCYFRIRSAVHKLIFDSRFILGITGARDRLLILKSTVERTSFKTPVNYSIRAFIAN